MLFRIYEERWWQLHIALRHCMQWIIFHKVNVPRPLLGRGPVRFDSCKRPPPVSDHSVFAFSVIAYRRLVSLAAVLWMSRSVAWHPRTSCDLRVRLSVWKTIMYPAVLKYYLQRMHSCSYRSLFVTIVCAFPFYLPTVCVFPLIDSTQLFTIALSQQNQQQNRLS